MKMKPYTDHLRRVVSFEVLDAMCEKVSGVVHTYRPVKLTERYCYIRFSNPDEYGFENPVTAVYPAYRMGIVGQTMICVVLDPVRIINDVENVVGEAFDRLTGCPTMHRHPKTGEWHTAEERVDDSDPPIIEWRESHIHDIAMERLGRQLTPHEMEGVIHDLDRLDFRSVEQAIEEVVILSVEKIEAETVA